MTGADAFEAAVDWAWVELAKAERGLRRDLFRSPSWCPPGLDRLFATVPPVGGMHAPPASMPTRARQRTDARRRVKEWV